MDIQIHNFLNILDAAINNSKRELTDPDWNKLYNYAIQHSILPLFYEGCNKYSEFDLVPAELKNRFFIHSMELIIWQAKRTEVFLTLYDKLAAAGIKPLILKGLICRNTYGDRSDHRPSGDEDIYIRTEEFQSCKEILVQAGFIMQDTIISDKMLSTIQHISFFNSGYGLDIEVHLSLMGNFNKVRKKLNSYFKGAFDHSIEYEINGHLIHTLSHTDHFLFLFLHFYKHFTASGVGIRQMIDILMYDRCYHDKINWEVVEDSIRDMSAAYLYADLINIGNHFLGFELKTKVKEYNIEALLEDMMDSGVYGKSTKEHTMSGRFTAAALENGSTGYVRIIFPKLSALKAGNTVLFEKPYLLPFIWIKRIFKFFMKKEQSKGKLLTNSMAIGRHRIQLLKKYSII